MADDAVGLEPWYMTQFATNVELILQQKGSKLRRHVSTKSHTGAKQAAYVNMLGTVRLQTPQGRFAPLARQDSDKSRRWVFPIDGELNQLVDTFDELRTMIDPKSDLVTNAMYAIGRGYDDEIIRATTALAYIGVDAGSISSESFDTTKFRIADTFGSSGASGLTVAKLIEAKRIFRHYENDFDAESPVLTIGSQQESDLLRQVQVVSNEFNDKPVLVDGKVTRFLGFNIECIERLSVYTTNTRGVLAWFPSGMHLGTWKDEQHIPSRRNDLSGHPHQLYSMVAFGAARKQAGKLIQIGCLDSTGAAITP